MAQTTEESSRLLGKCPFCHLGDESKRGVLELIIRTKDEFGRVVAIDKGYRCALGEAGKGCTIPELFKRIYVVEKASKSPYHQPPIA